MAISFSRRHHKKGNIPKRTKYEHHHITSRKVLDTQLLTSVLLKASISHLRALLSRGARLNCSNSLGYTPLLLALSRGHDDQSVQVVSSLCELGVDVNLTSDVFYGDTPLHFACQLKNSEYTRILLVNNANARARNHAGYTPLHVAALHGNVEIVKLLCLNGADVNATELYCGYTPLHLAANHCHDDVLSVLVQCGADVLQCDFQGAKSIDRCQSSSSKEILWFCSVRPRSLEDRCIQVIQTAIGRFSGLEGYEKLPLPNIVKTKIMMNG